MNSRTIIMFSLYKCYGRKLLVLFQLDSGQNGCMPNLSVHATIATWYNYYNHHSCLMYLFISHILLERYCPSISYILHVLSTDSLVVMDLSSCVQLLSSCIPWPNALWGCLYLFFITLHMILVTIAVAIADSTPLTRVDATNNGNQNFCLKLQRTWLVLTDLLKTLELIKINVFGIH